MTSRPYEFFPGRATVGPQEDYHPTPECAARALLKHDLVPFHRGVIWEPSCGDGAISKVLLDSGRDVESTDLFDHGFGEAGVDFLETNASPQPAGIITNPPYSIAEKFIRHALENAPYVAMLLQLQFLGSSGRHQLWSELRPSRVWVFSRPLPFWKDGVWKRGSFTHMWAVWDGKSMDTNLGWIPPEETVMPEVATK